MPACKIFEANLLPGGTREINDAPSTTAKNEPPQQPGEDLFLVFQVVPYGPHCEEAPRASSAAFRRPRLSMPAPAFNTCDDIFQHRPSPTPAHHLGRTSATWRRCATRRDANPPTLPLRNPGRGTGVLGRFGILVPSRLPCRGFNMTTVKARPCARSLPISPLRDTGRWSRPV